MNSQSIYKQQELRSYFIGNMDCRLELTSYAGTGYFSPLILDFLQEDEKLKPFYQYSPLKPDFRQAIEARKTFQTNRKLLVQELEKQYHQVEAGEKVRQNIRALSDENTFTVCTAHQPNLFTGYLYFAYKILQTVRLAEQLGQQFPGCRFVPVYYMGSEDNDLDELGRINLDGETLVWRSSQKGAVGRMKPEGLEPMLDQVERHLGVSNHAQELMELLRYCYLSHPDIQTATLHLVNALFGEYGLVVLIPDTPAFKRVILPVMKEELFRQVSFPIVQKTIDRLSVHYYAQAHPREINLFYLSDQLRERIVREKDTWHVLNTDLKFTQKELEEELEQHPERFSPNVILRGILQESILPNIAFIGGGGEIAYWLELKGVFEYFRVPYPVLLLRNSFLWVEEKAAKQLQKVGLQPVALFQDVDYIIAQYVQAHTRQYLALKEERQAIAHLYDELLKKAGAIDTTLKASVNAERSRSLRSIDKLEHKFLRAEKKHFAWQTALISRVKEDLFPRGSLQERVENLLPYYAKYGPAFIRMVYDHLDPLASQFSILTEMPRA